jgi:hypothetical protein
VREKIAEAVLPLPAVSLARSLATETCTTPSPPGMISTEYKEPLPAKFDTVPFVTLRSLEINPDTSSLKVIITGMGDTFVTELAVDDRLTFIAVWS